MNAFRSTSALPYAGIADSADAIPLSLAQLPHPSGGSEVSLVVDPMQLVLSALQAGNRFLVCSHARPDGDAIGSMLALGMLLEEMGKQVDLVSADCVPSIYRGLPGANRIRAAINVEGSYDAAILLECDSLERPRLNGLDQYFVVNIDHHLSGNDYGHLNWLDCSAASVGEMVHRLVVAMGGTVTPGMATCLYTTLLTDTACFCLGATSATTFGLARDLVQAGADPIRIAQDLYYAVATSRLLILGKALQNLKREGRLAWLSVTHRDMVRCCAADEDCDSIVNHAISIAGVEVAVFLRELPEGRIRVSLRSKISVNVAEIAERLGGGGHRNAAGFILEGSIIRAREEILAILRLAVAPGCEESVTTQE